jgi:hypothetical protein
MQFCRAIYDVISGPAGGRDWSRFRSIVLPQARFTEGQHQAGWFESHSDLERGRVYSRRWRDLFQRTVSTKKRS